MIAKSILKVLCFVIVLHLVALSFAFGPRRWSYVLIAYSSAVVVWGLVFLMHARRRAAGWVAGSLVVVVIQQLASRNMGWELPNAFWTVAQFFALQFLVGVAVKRVFDRRQPVGVRRTNQQ